MTARPRLSRWTSPRCRAELPLRRAGLCLGAGVLLAAAAILPACGKKGPPLAPLLKVPGAPQDVVARRDGDAVGLQLRIPGTNTDGTRPADIRRVEVYGFTGQSPTPAEVVKYGSLVASIPVRKPPEEEEGSREDAARRGTAPPRPPASLVNGFDQGDVVTVFEALGPGQSSPVEIPPRRKQPPPPAPDPWHPALNPSAGPVRLYFEVGVNHKGQRGVFTPPQPVPLGPAPSAPSSPAITYDATGVTLSWTAPPDVPKPSQAPPTEGELPSTPRGLRAPLGGYNVYEVSPGTARPGSGASPAVPVEPRSLPKPLNEQLLQASTFKDARVEYGRERCYQVRAVLQEGTQVTESEPSPAACVTPADTFPPAAPKGLAAVASEGAISLIWEANTEPDLAGYLVMRAEPGGVPQPVTPEPIKETTFRDTTAVRGVRYAYTLVAVDTSGNRSAPSNAAEETAR